MSREDEHNYDACDNVAINLGTKSETSTSVKLGSDEVAARDCFRLRQAQP